MMIAAGFSAALVLWAASTQVPVCKGSLASELPATEDEAAKSSFIVLHADVPRYLPIAAMARVSGIVRIRLTVKDGVVADMEPVCSASPLLTSAAQDNIRTWQFDPGATGSFASVYVYSFDDSVGTMPVNPRVEMQLPVRVKITTGAVQAMPMASQ